VDAENIDLRYDGRPGALGAWLSRGVLIDCGPGTCVRRLLDGLGEARPRALVLTHIHLDHAGAAGALVARWPELPVYVHPAGAPHLVDPSKLIASARRVFGETLEPLFGEMLPVPAANVRALADGESAAGLQCAFTPGHASHHVAFLDRASGVAYTGDLAGVRLAEGAVLPPTPPPEVDLRLWESSLALLESWRPDALALAHFGLVESPGEHVALLREALERHERWAAAGEEAFVSALHEWLSASLAPPRVADYEFVAMARQSALGLRRWLAQRARS
jgi:glyoxylase-like metal-dependent hydrolase (beta-lactamase superfamily II)